MYIKESIQRIMNCDKSIPKHICLFSICGTVGLVDTLIALKGFLNLNLEFKIGYIAFWTIFLLFITGYETLFLHERQLPEIDMKPFKIAFKNPIFTVFLIEFLVFAVRLVYESNLLLILSDLLIAIPLVAVQAGFSYNFDRNESFVIFKKLNIKNFTVMALKRLFIMLCSYLIVFIILATAILGVAIGLLIAAKGYMNYVIYTIMAQQTIITKLSLFLLAILLQYILINASFIWDYEFVKTLEEKQRNNSNSDSQE